MRPWKCVCVTLQQGQVQVLPPRVGHQRRKGHEREVPYAGLTNQTAAQVGYRLQETLDEETEGLKRGSEGYGLVTTTYYCEQQDYKCTHPLHLQSHTQNKLLIPPPNLDNLHTSTPTLNPHHRTPLRSWSRRSPATTL